MKRSLIVASVVAALFTGVASVSAQERAIKPLDVPMSFSGTYGELRRNHFHGGVDWRVGGKVGDPIHVIKSGYISRVSVSTGGYGNGVYVQHPDGTMTVYGHLLEFTPQVAARVKKEQYRKENFSVSLDFSPDEFPVRQGDVIGKVGSTGASAGPHLHMEVRDSRNTPLNYLAMGYYAPVDGMKPEIARIAFYAFDDCKPVPNRWRVRNIFQPQQCSEVVRLPEESYVAIDSYDLQDGTTGKLAVEQYRVLLDCKCIFHLGIGNVGFEEGSDIKSLIEYGESYRGGRDLIKSYVEPGNSLAYKTRSLDGGLIRLTDNSVHLLTIETSDISGNTRTVKLKVQRDDSLKAPERNGLENSSPLLWYAPNMVSNGDFIYLLTPGSLYDSCNLTWKKVSGPAPEEGRYSATLKVGDERIPLKKNGMLIINCDRIPSLLLDKAYIATVPGLSYAGPLKGAKVGFGTYCIAVDSEGPDITVDKNDVIHIRDEYSGTASVRLEIDGKWHLFRMKGGRVMILDRSSISKGRHRVTVTAKDYLGNTSVLEEVMSF
ncbi:MAG: M23 family metallopeptidase [Bacteroidales bacterium]|nr:M23 family metallopeptidase [Candidatus Cacconaster merdequi]